MKSLWIKIRIYLYAMVILTGCSDATFTDVGSPMLGELDLPSGSFHSQTFIQRSIKGKVDLLVVVDNSGSMAEEQAKLGARVSNFLSQIDDVDWQLGVTTTDVSDGPFGLKGSILPLGNTTQKILNKSVPNYNSLFLDTVVREETFNCTTDCPSGTEQPLRAAMMAMDQRDGNNSGLFRSDADLGVLILSDEDEMSNGAAGATTGTDVIDHFKSIWGNSKEMYGYAIITQPGDDACVSSQTNSQAYFGILIDEFVQMTRGMTGSICHEDYGTTLGSIGENLGQLLNFFELHVVPEDGTVKVRLVPEMENEDDIWYIQGRRLYFTELPPKGTQIIVDYIVK